MKSSPINTTSNAITVEDFLTYVEKEKSLIRKENESDKEFNARRSEFYKQFDLLARTVCKKISTSEQALRFLEPAAGESEMDFFYRRNELTKELDRETELLCRKLLERGRIYQAGAEPIFQQFALNNREAFKEICFREPQMKIEQAMGDPQLAGHYLNEFKNEYINELLISMFNYGVSLDQLFHDVFWAAQDKEAKLRDYDDFDDEQLIEKRKEPSPESANYNEWLAYHTALQQFLKFREKFPTLDADIKAKHEAVEKQFGVNRMKVTALKYDIHSEIEKLVQAARQKIPDLKNAESNTVQWFMQSRGEAALRTDTYIHNDPELQSIFLQLKGFSEIQKSLSDSPKAIFIKTDAIAKEIENAALYKVTDNRRNQNKPYRIQQFMRNLIKGNSPTEKYSLARHSTLFSIIETAKRSAKNDKVARDASKKFKEKTTEIYQKLTK